MEFTITSDQILGWCGFFASVFAVYKIWKEIKKPTDDKNKMILEHEGKLKKIEERLKGIESTDKLMLQGFLVVINHDITGNGIDQLKNTRDEIQEYLINK